MSEKEVVEKEAVEEASVAEEEVETEETEVETNAAEAPAVITSPAGLDDREAVKLLSRVRDEVRAELRKRIVGQQQVIDLLLTALFAKGHTLLVGVPGLAKTLMISTLAEILDLSFNRIQFTPDLMPSDITGTDILEEDATTGRRHFRFVKGPIFCNMLLADEINRTPPKTQAALLQAMQEYHVTAAGASYELAPPFFVMATQNPIEQEGTYPLPEAQLDRFMFQVHIHYPSADEELEIVRSTTSALSADVKHILDAARIVELQQVIRRVPVPEHVLKYAVELVRKTRPKEADAADMCKEYLTWGAGPRASQYLILGGKSRAVLDGRFSVEKEDIRALANPVLSHRLLPNFHAEATGVSSSDVIEHLLTKVK